MNKNIAERVFNRFKDSEMPDRYLNAVVEYLETQPENNLNKIREEAIVLHEAMKKSIEALGFKKKVEIEKEFK